MTRSAIELVFGLSLLTAWGEVGSGTWQKPVTNAQAPAQTMAPAVQGQVGGVEFIMLEEVFELNRTKSMCCRFVGRVLDAWAWRM